MDWAEVTTASITAALPTDVKARYDAWLVAYPDKSGRLAEIVDRTIREFRDNIKSVPKNIVDERETYVPLSAVRHVETIVVFSLAMEMGLPIDSAGTGARYAADIFLRQILMGRYETTTDAAGEPSPKYSIPERTEAGRALPLIAAALVFLTPFMARAGWIRPDAGPSDTEVLTTAVPSAYSITAQTLFGHLVGINTALGLRATEAYVNAAVAGVSITNAVDQTARDLATVASASANAAITGILATLDLAGTRAMTGNSVTLARDVKSRDATSVENYGAAFGRSTTAGYGGAAFGDSTTAGDYSAAFGLETAAGNYSAAFGLETVAGNYGFGAGRRGKGAAGSFVFADATNADFDRTASPNSFNLRVAGGIYALIGTNVFAVSNTVTMNGVELGAGGTGTGWTNLAFSGTGAVITNATAAGDTLTLERGTVAGSGATQLIANVAGQAARTSTYNAGTATLTLTDLPAPEGGGTATEIAEGAPQAIALADGFVTLYSTGLWEQAYTAAGAATVRVVKVNASNPAAIIFHAAVSNHATTFETNNLTGYTVTGIATNGNFSSFSLRSKPGSTNWTWSLDLP